MPAAHAIHTPVAASTSTGPAGCTLEAAGVSDRGHVRPSNQDCFGVAPEVGLLIVADGMGGHAGGEVASQMAMTTVIECLQLNAADATDTTAAAEAAAAVDDTDDVDDANEETVADAPWSARGGERRPEPGGRLRQAFHAAHHRLLEATRHDPELEGMGTTLVAAQQQGSRLVVAWAGDSRLYVVDATGVHRVTRDDSWVELMLAEHPDADAEAVAAIRQHPFRHALTNVVGSSGRPEVHVAEVAVTDGMRVALTTDGVHGVLTDDHIGQLLTHGATPAQTAADLVREALGAGSSDNCTAVVGHFGR